jgi:hypothetical protein
MLKTLRGLEVSRIKESSEGRRRRRGGGGLAINEPTKQTDEQNKK